MNKPTLTAERALALVTEIAATESPNAKEVAALSICVSAIESLPELSRKRTVRHLSDMFDGPYSLDILVALLTEIAELKKQESAHVR